MFAAWNTMLPFVAAVERALKRTALDMRVETYEMQIGGQENPHLNSNIANAIGTCNLIIDIIFGVDIIVVFCVFVE